MQLLCAQDDAPDLRALYATTAAPAVRLGMVTSLDGRAALDGRSQGLSGAPDRQVFRVLRGLADVVLVGAGTVRAERYRPVRLDEATQRERRERGQAVLPPVAVVSQSGRIDPDSPLLAEPAGTLLITCEAAARPVAGAELLVAGERDVDLAAALTALRGRGLSQVLCEGGPVLAGALSAAGLLDELCLTTSPLLVGRGPALLQAAGPLRQRFVLRHLLHDDGFLLARWQLQRT